MARPALLLPALLGLAFSAGVALAEPLEKDEAVALLQRIADAARKLNYVGTFVYQHGEQFEASRIGHVVHNGEELEKLESLDGPRREIIRRNDEVLCYWPEAKILRIEKRVSRRTFPAVLPEDIETITEHYQIRKGDSERIAGFESQALVLEPRDSMRYGHKFWTHTATGLLLKARMEDENRNVVEQFVFTQLAVGSGITPAMVKPTFKARAPEWRLDRIPPEASLVPDPDAVVKGIPPGFRKIMEMHRSKQGASVTVTHQVYSDGLASVSVFIEPSATRSRFNEGLTRQGPINIFTTRNSKDQLVTVLGETPAVTVKQIGNTVSSRGE